MSGQVEAILGELRRRLESLYGERLVRMVLFGSQARGEAEARSGASRTTRASGAPA